MTTLDAGDRRTTPLRVLRRAARATLDALDRILHTARRRRASRLVRAAGTPKSILFICHGNVCRSPYAEAVLSRPGLLRLRNTSVASAGFIGPDRSSPDAALAVAGRRGVDMREHRSQLMSTELLARPALLVVMDARQRRAVSGMAGRPASEILILGDLDPLGADRRGIKDPWGKPEAVFEEVYERVERCVLEMARLLNEAAEVAEG